MLHTTYYIFTNHIEYILNTDNRYMQKIEALHAAVAQGSLREVQAMLGRAKLALSKVKTRMVAITCKVVWWWGNVTHNVCKGSWESPKIKKKEMDFFLNCGWVGVKCPKLFSENTMQCYMAYLTIQTLNHIIFPRIFFFFQFFTFGVLNLWGG